MLAGARLETYKDPFLPDSSFDWRKTICLPLKITDARKIRRSLQFTLERIGPAVIRTTKLIRSSLRLGHDCRCVMPADIEEAAQHFVVSHYNYDRCAGNVRGDVSPWLAYLIDAPGHVP